MEKRQCEELVSPKESWDIHLKPCKNAAKVEVNGKWYCGIHDPNKVNERQAAQAVKWQKRWNKDHFDRAMGEVERVFMIIELVTGSVDEELQKRIEAYLRNEYNQ